MEKYKVGELVKYKGELWVVKFIWTGSTFHPTRYEIHKLNDKTWCVAEERELKKGEE